MLLLTAHVSWWHDTAAAWLTATATSVGVVAAIIAGIFAGLAFRQEQRRDDRREREDQLAQASRVAAWPLLREPSRDIRAAVRPRWFCLLRNASDVPVYDVSIKWRHRNRPLGNQHVPILPPSDSPVEVAVDPAVLQELIRIRTDWLTGLGGVNIEITFTDSAGRIWNRNPVGGLWPIPKD